MNKIDKLVIDEKTRASPDNSYWHGGLGSFRFSYELHWLGKRFWVRCMIQIKRIYDPIKEDDGYRILVDRLWPRGVSKEKAKLDLWMKEIAPSTDLRKWFNHDSAKWDEFKLRYRKELIEKKDLISKLRSIEEENKRVTLLYSAKDTEHNQAVGLLDLLNSL